MDVPLDEGDRIRVGRMDHDRGAPSLTDGRAQKSCGASNPDPRAIAASCMRFSF